MKKIKVALLGCGDRGCIYADYSLRNPDDMEIVAVIDNSELKKETARVRYALPESLAFDSVEDFIKAGIVCDIVIAARSSFATFSATPPSIPQSRRSSLKAESAESEALC